MEPWCQKIRKALGMCEDLDSSSAALHQVEMHARPGHLPESRLAEQSCYRDREEMPRSMLAHCGAGRSAIVSRPTRFMHCPRQKRVFSWSRVRRRAYIRAPGMQPAQPACCRCQPCPCRAGMGSGPRNLRRTQQDPHLPKPKSTSQVSNVRVTFKAPRQLASLGTAEGLRMSRSCRSCLGVLQTDPRQMAARVLALVALQHLARPDGVSSTKFCRADSARVACQTT